METRKVRTPSARMLASKQGDEYEKIASTPQSTTSARERPPTLLQTPEGQLAYVKKVSEAHHQITHRSPHLHTHHPNNPMPSRPRAPLEIRKVVAIAHQSPPPMEEEIDVSSNGGAELVDHTHMEEVEEEVDDVVEEIQRGGGGLEMIQKQEKMDAQMVMNGDFSVASEVTISSMKYQGRPSGTHGTPQMRQKRVSNFTGETLNLKSSDLSIPNKAAHFLYFRCYEEHEVQKEFPLTIDENRKGPQNFLVEPRVGLKNTDYYIDSYLWNRGKSTSSKKKIFVEIEGNHVKTSRRSCETAHYVLNWYYSNMENRICKKVCWLETVADCVRASPVLVQYHVNYLSDNPIELRKTPKLYSDTRSVAQELLRSDSPLQTVQRFVETGETDPREIINKKQAYEMRRYVMANARKRGQRKFEDMYFDDEMFEEIYYNEHGEPINVRNTTNRGEQQTDAGRAAQLAVRMEGRRIENRIARMLDNRLPAPKNYADILSEWIGALESTSQDNFHMVIHDVVNSMRKQMDDMLGGGEHEHEFLVDEPTTSGNSGNAAKRMKLMGEEEELNHDVVEEEEDEDGHTTTRRVETTTKRFEGERYIFDGQEYVEEEVIAEEIEEVVVPSDTVVVDETTVVVGERGDADETNGEEGEEVVHEEVVVEETVPEEH